MTYWALGFSKNATCGRGEETKKGQKLSCVKLAICPDHPRRRIPLKFCMRGRVREVVIYFKFYKNRSRGLRAVEGRKSPSPIDLAHGLYDSLYYRTSRDDVELCCWGTWRKEQRREWLDRRKSVAHVTILQLFIYDISLLSFSVS